MQKKAMLVWVLKSTRRPFVLWARRTVYEKSLSFPGWPFFSKLICC